MTRLTITYVEYRLYDQPVEPLFIVHVFGVPFPLSSHGIEEARRTRYLLNERGKIIKFDNCL